MEKGEFTNFKNSYKINKNSFNDNFFAVVIRGKRKFTLAEKILGVSGTLKTYLPIEMNLNWTNTRQITEVSNSPKRQAD